MVLDAGTAGGRLEVTPPSPLASPPTAHVPPHRSNEVTPLPSRPPPPLTSPPDRSSAYMRFTERSKGSKGARGAQVALDEAVDDAALAARFSKRRHTLTLTLPIR